MSRRDIATFAAGEEGVAVMAVAASARRLWQDRLVDRRRLWVEAVAFGQDEVGARS